MARVIDLAAAFEGRGFNAHLSVEVDLAVSDPEAPANSGRWILKVSGGRGTAIRTGRPAVRGEGHAHQTPGITSNAAGDGDALRVDARGLSALWCGWSVSRLRQAGLATGGTAEADAALDAVFAGQPFITEYF